MIFRFLKGAKLYFVIAAIFSCASSLAEMIRPKIIEYTIDGILRNNTKAMPSFLTQWMSEMGGIAFLRSHLWLAAAAVIVTSLLAVVLRYIYHMSVVKGGEQFVRRMRDELFGHIERLSAEWHSSHQTGDVIQRCTSDVESVKTFLSEHLVNLFSMLVTIAFSLFFMFRISWQLALIALVSIPVIVSISLWFHHGITENFRACDENEGALSSIAQENLTGVRVVRAFGKERAEQKRFDQQNRTVTMHWVKLGKLFTIYFFFIDLISGLIMLGILAFGVVMCVRGNLTVGALLAILSYMTMLLRPVRSMGRVLSEMSKTGVSIQRIYEIMCAAPETDDPDAVEAPMDRDIVFEHVTFSYPDQPKLLDDVSFTIPAGSTLGILGATGSGKSTLAQLLTRFWKLPAENGRITVGGTDLQKMPASWVRKNIGYVMQEPYLFSRSIAENIGITQDEADSDSIRKAADMAVLSDAVEHFPKGFDTFVGERGVTLSGGQKQRTAIARALSQHTPILIFDDSLSAVDAETDAAIRANLKASTGHSTVILISHRITTLMAADQILVLKDGKIADRGTHEELSGRPGLYQTICGIQLGKEELSNE